MATEWIIIIKQYLPVLHILCCHLWQPSHWSASCRGRTILLHCIQLSSDIVKLKEVFLPHPFYHVSGLLLKIFSIWLAHALGSGIDSKNNTNPYTRYILLESSWTGSGIWKDWSTTIEWSSSFTWNWKAIINTRTKQISVI